MSTYPHGLALVRVYRTMFPPRACTQFMAKAISQVNIFAVILIAAHLWQSKIYRPGRGGGGEGCDTSQSLLARWLHGRGSCKKLASLPKDVVIKHACTWVWIYVNARKCKTILLYWWEFGKCEFCTYWQVLNLIIKFIYTTKSHMRACTVTPWVWMYADLPLRN